jgi:hypothetical protein
MNRIVVMDLTAARWTLVPTLRRDRRFNYVYRYGSSPNHCYLICYGLRAHDLLGQVAEVRLEYDGAVAKMLDRYANEVAAHRDERPGGAARGREGFDIQSANAFITSYREQNVGAIGAREKGETAEAGGEAATEAGGAPESQQEEPPVRFWQFALGTIREQVGLSVFQSYFFDTRLTQLDPATATTTATVIVGNPLVRDCLERKHLALMRQALGDALGYPVIIRLVVRGERI